MACIPPASITAIRTTFVFLLHNECLIALKSFLLIPQYNKKVHHPSAHSEPHANMISVNFYDYTKCIFSILSLMFTFTINISQFFTISFYILTVIISSRMMMDNYQIMQINRQKLKSEDCYFPRSGYHYI